MQNYDAAEVLAWLRDMEQEIMAYAGRMASMSEAALDEAQFDRLCAILRRSDFELTQHGALLVPAPLAKLVTGRIGIPTIGIGAGADCDGPVLVFHDMVGMFSGFTPTFVKRYAEAGAAIKDAVARYAAEVRDGSFPGEGKSFGMKDEVIKRLYGT